LFFLFGEHATDILAHTLLLFGSISLSRLAVIMGEELFSLALLSADC
jgi:hypothetical protein